MKKPIGIFDSGVGGLTVYKTIRTTLLKKTWCTLEIRPESLRTKSPNTIMITRSKTPGFCYNRDKDTCFACILQQLCTRQDQELTGNPIIVVIDPVQSKRRFTRKAKELGLSVPKPTVRSVHMSSDYQAYS
jgi:hypothetical protein